MRKIIADSACDLEKLDRVAKGASFSVVPLKITVEDLEFVDDSNLDLDAMLEALANTKGKTGTACPSPADFEDAFEEAEEVFVVTITSQLSGTYNSAMLAKSMYEDKYSDKKVYVFDSLTTSGEMVLIVNKINELIGKNKTFEEIIKEVEEYRKHTHLTFVLYSIDNLVRNGRVNKIVGAALNVLGIKIISRASEDGVIQPIGKARGKEKAYANIIKEMQEQGYKGGKIEIAHCNNLEGALYCKEKILALYPNAEISIRKTRGLVSYYAENHSVLVGYEC